MEREKNVLYNKKRRRKKFMSHEEKERRFFKFLKGGFYKYALIGIVPIVLVAIFILGYNIIISHDTKTTKIGFEDIGELATQEAYCTEVNCTDDVKKLFKIKLPFTQSKYIYSYDVVIKAGIDFGKIKWEEDNSKIKVVMPEAKILSCEVKSDSLKVYHEKESIFNQITIEENNSAIIELKETAEKNAIENGILKKATDNAKTVLTGFFGNQYDLEKYKIEFKSK